MSENMAALLAACPKTRVDEDHIPARMSYDSAMRMSVAGQPEPFEVEMPLFSGRRCFLPVLDHADGKVKTMDLPRHVVSMIGQAIEREAEARRLRASSPRGRLERILGTVMAWIRLKRYVDPLEATPVFVVSKERLERPPFVRYDVRIRAA